MRALSILCFLLLLASNSVAYNTNYSQEVKGIDVELELAALGVDINSLEFNSASAENERLLSIILGIALGPFGGHRLYLGTKPHVPVVYTLTLGGGFGILPLIDIFHIIFTKDLAPYRNNGNVFMWRPDKSTQQ